MIKFLFAAAFGLFLSNGAFAAQISSDSLANLPSISEPTIKLHMPPQFAAVQPRANLLFKHASCAAMPLKLSVKDAGAVLLVKVVLPPQQMDCMGTAITRDYDLQISSDYAGQRVVVLNPLVPVQHNIAVDELPTQRPRMCTQNAGLLVEIETGLCKGFTNGCQQNDMLSSGNFRRAEDNECFNVDLH